MHPRLIRIRSDLGKSTDWVSVRRFGFDCRRCFAALCCSHLSKEFFDLVKSIGESRSKQEEDKIILREVGVLKAKMVCARLRALPSVASP